MSLNAAQIAHNRNSNTLQRNKSLIIFNIVAIYCFGFVITTL